MSVKTSLLLVILVSSVSMDGALAANVAIERGAGAASKPAEQTPGKPVGVDYRSQVLGEMKMLASLSQRASFKLRRSIGRLKAEGVDTGHYADLANKYDEFAAFVNRKQLAVSNGSRAYTSSDLQSLKDVSENMQSGMDKLGNFDVQELMSRATQAANLAAAIKKDLDKAKEGIVGNIGGGSDDSGDPDD